jgi:hypothetical protein
MANNFEVDAEVVSDLGTFSKGLGPKEVRTPNMTVVTHDPDKLQKAQERGRAANYIPTICGLGGCVSTPKPGAYDAGDCDDTVR